MNILNVSSRSKTRKIMENNMTQEELRKVVYSFRVGKPRFCSVITETVPKMKKIDGFKPDCYKRSEIAVLMGANYANMVNNARVREAWAEIESEAQKEGFFSLPDIVSWAESHKIVQDGEFEVDLFEPKPRTWGKRVDDTCLIHHVKDGVEKYYMDVPVMKSKEHSYWNGQYKLDNKWVEQYITGSEPNQGLKNPIHWRTYGLESVKLIKYDGVWHEVSDV